MISDLLSRLAADAQWLENRGIQISSIREARLALKETRPGSDGWTAGMLAAAKLVEKSAPTAAVIIRQYVDREIAA